MLENIKNLVRQYGGDLLKDEAIPEGRKDEVVADASSSIISGLKATIASGKTDALLDFFKGGSESIASSPVTKNIEVGFVNNLMNKFGLSSGKAAQIASAIIPIVLQKIVHKTNNSEDKDFNLSSIIAQLSGSEGVQSIFNKLKDNNKDEDGGLLGKVKSFF